MRIVLSQIWRLAVICAWQPGGRFGIALFAVVFALGLVSVQITVRLIRWTNDFYNALQRVDVTEAINQIGVFFLLVATSAALYLASAYLRKMLQIRWRKVLTDVMLGHWLAGKAYWHMRDRTEHGLDNPDQRIADDCRIFVYRLTTEALELITNIVALVTYFTILWNLSTFPLSFQLFGLDMSIARYMVWAAPIYVAISSGVTHWLGAPLVPLNVQQQKTEADFRFALSRFRGAGEQVALIGGEAAERRLFQQRFEAIVLNWRQLMNREFILGCFTRPYMQTVLRIPLFLALPAFLAGRLTFGGLMQIGSAFQNVVTTLSWFIFSYRDLAELASAAKRLDNFREAAVTASMTESGTTRGEGASLRLANIELCQPDGRSILRIDGTDVTVGETVWLRGRSGLGKTTLARTVAGIWPHGTGRIDYPPGHLAVLPQQAYLPIGSVADAAVYPADAANLDRRDISAALTRVGLTRLAAAASLDADVSSLGLSGGERQRLVLARLLIDRPDHVVLDEATSALDEEAEAAVLSALRRELPDATFVIIAHREPKGLGSVRTITLE